MISPKRVSAFFNTPFNFGFATLAGFILIALLPSISLGQSVVINEIMANPADRKIIWTADGAPKLGLSPAWCDVTFDDGAWFQARLPLGYGHEGLSSSLISSYAEITSTLYFRKSFSLDQYTLDQLDNLVLNIRFADGYVAYLNGVEIARGNMGPPRMYPYYDHEAWNASFPDNLRTLDIGNAVSLLQEGENVLAVQIHRSFRQGDDGLLSLGLYLDASLVATGGTEATLVPMGEDWSFFPGLVEPSGGVYDDSFLDQSTAVSTPVWILPDFDDSSWATGLGPLGYDSGPHYNLGVNLYDQMYEQVVSLYMRVEFEVSESWAQSDQPLELIMDYDDGYVGYLNGREMARENLGEAGDFIAFDQSVSNYHNASNDGGDGVDRRVSYSLGSASEWLNSGQNTIAFQVHNAGIYSSDLILAPVLRIAGTIQSELIVPEISWNYYIGYDDPSGEQPAFPWYLPFPEISDWIELHNTTDTPIDLTGWSITDDSDEPAKWTFPEVIFPANGYLTIIASGWEGESRPGNWIHTNFKLSSGGEYLGLYDTGGNLVHELAPEYPEMDENISYGFSSAGNHPGFLTIPTPGKENSAEVLGDVLPPPEIIPDQRFQIPPFEVELSNTEEAVTIRYTTDGSEPTLDNGYDYVGPIVRDRLLTGQVKYELWFNAPGSDIFDIPVDRAPEVVEWLNTTDAWNDIGSNFGARISGYIVPPVSGEYIFYLAADHVARFSLSTDNSAFNLVTRIHLTEPTGYHSFDEFVNQRSVALTLNEGQYYYFEILHKEEFGSNHATLAWSGPGFTREILSSGILSSEYGGKASGLAIRARAFKEGYLPSPISTRTFLINTPSEVRSLPIVALTGDQEKSLFKPYGATAIEGDGWVDLGGYAGNIIWTPVEDGDYNMPIIRGRPMERPVSIEFIETDGINGFQADGGIRVSGSGHMRPRYHLDELNSGFWIDPSNKPSFNIYFRDDYSGDLDYRIFPESSVDKYTSIRLRAGKNDPMNPFIRDEFIRRLFVDMGQIGSVGRLTGLVVNGEFRGYYNPVQHCREKFFQEAYNSDYDWDVKQMWDLESGDWAHYDETMNFARYQDFSVLDNYETLCSYVDPVNLADYIILNAYAAMWDWPGNNWVMAHERSEKGRWRFYVWDAEGSFELYAGRYPIDYDTFATDLLNELDWEWRDISLVYKAFHQSPEFRLLMADRLNRHFFNEGTMTNDHMIERHEELSSEIASVMSYVLGWDYDSSWFWTWISGRRDIFFNQCRNHDLWPDLNPPELSQHGGNVNPGFQLTINNPGGVGEVYYTTDGTDPRLTGGAIQGDLYEIPLVLTNSTRIKTRVKSGDTWSALTEAVFAVPDSIQLTVTEIMYNPPDQGDILGNELEFLEIKNIGTGSLSLGGAYFSDGITYEFPSDTMIGAGEHWILVSNQTSFSAKYPNIPVIGEYEGQLANGGESVTLLDVADHELFSFEYEDADPWPEPPDGDGFSLVLVDEGISGTDLSIAESWRSSTNPGGSPGTIDPLPEVNSIFINEILTHTDLPQVDTVELFNPNQEAVMIGGWFLTDDQETPKKYRIPDDTWINQQGYWVVTENEFGPDANPDSGFRLSSHGEGVWIFSADENGNLTGYRHGVEFGAAANGVSFGRYINDSGEELFPAQMSLSLGTENSGPLIGPLVINEIMYNPLVPGVEYIEIINISQETILLYDPYNPENTWKLSGVAYDFPIGSQLESGKIAIICANDPAEFRSTHALPQSFPVYGPFPGSLDNAGEKISVKRPDLPDVDEFGQITVPYITVDEVKYDEQIPWPLEPDGQGPALEKINFRKFSNDAQNWQSNGYAGGTPGALILSTMESWRLVYFTGEELAIGQNVGNLDDFENDYLENLLEYAFGLDPKIVDSPAPVEILTVESNGEFFAALKFRRKLIALDLSYIVQLSDDLKYWYDAGQEVVQYGSAANNGDGTETVIFRQTVSLNESENAYMRLKLSIN